MEDPADSEGAALEDTAQELDSKQVRQINVKVTRPIAHELYRELECSL